jgi:hypothetical protein
MILNGRDHGRQHERKGNANGGAGRRQEGRGEGAQDLRGKRISEDRQRRGGTNTDRYNTFT